MPNRLTNSRAVVCAAALLRLVRRHEMVEHDHDPRRVAHLQDLAPARRQEVHVGEHAGSDLDDRDLAGPTRAAPAALARIFSAMFMPMTRLPLGAF